MEWTASKDDIERWLKELHEECARAEFQEVYKAGWRDALTGLMIKMDEARKIANSPPEGHTVTFTGTALPYHLWPRSLSDDSEGTMFPKHEIDPTTHRCKRCLRDRTELASDIYSCMTDEQIEWTTRKVEAIRRLGQ